MDPDLRAYRSDDAAATLAVFVASVTRTAAAHYTPEQIAAWCPPSIDEGAWDAARSAAWTVVAERDGAVVGFADLTAAGELDRLFVHPDAGGTGVARQLTARVLDEAARRGLTRVTTRASRAARPAFERFGFVVDRENTDNVVRGVTVPNTDLHIDLPSRGWGGSCTAG